MSPSDPWDKRPASAKARPEPPLPPRVPPATKFRAEIEAALRDGLTVEDMILHLSHRAADNLKRDRSVSDEDIRYSNGAMLFLGVTVVVGAEASRLDRAPT